MSDRRGREWLRRAEHREPLTDRSSRPASTPANESLHRVRIVELRRQWLTVRPIARTVGVSASTAARICRASGLSRLTQLDAPATFRALPARSSRRVASHRRGRLVICARVLFGFAGGD
jgi:hypothetical protein